jgi:hypothetical protein
MPLDKPHSASRDGDIHLIECPECLWPHPTDPRLAAAKLSIPHIESNVLTSLAVRIPSHAQRDWQTSAFVKFGFFFPFFALASDTVRYRRIRLFKNEDVRLDRCSLRDYTV